MRAAVLSDIHANLPALEAVFSRITEQDIDRHIFCGDAIGYYCWPNEVLRALQERDIQGVRGNHDDAIIHGTDLTYPVQRWTAERLTPESRAFLERLPYTWRDDATGQDVFIVHGSPRAPVEEYVYPEQVDERFFTEQAMGTLPDVLMMGHTHVPFIKQVGKTLVVNPGSVGQPRDGNPDASYALLDLESPSAEIRRVSYDIDTVTDRMQEEGLPASHAERLYAGR